MAFSTTVKLGAGSKMFYGSGGATPTFKLLDNALDIGQVGTQGEFVQVTPISKTVHEYIAAMETPPQKQISFNHVPGVEDYAAFLALVDAKGSIQMRVDYTTGDRATFTLVASGRVMDTPQGSAQLQMICFFQQSGGVTWGEVE